MKELSGLLPVEDAASETMPACSPVGCVAADVPAATDRRAKPVSRRWPEPPSPDHGQRPVAQPAAGFSFPRARVRGAIRAHACACTRATREAGFCSFLSEREFRDQYAPAGAGGKRARGSGYSAPTPYPTWTEFCHKYAQAREGQPLSMSIAGARYGFVPSCQRMSIERR